MSPGGCMAQTAMIAPAAEESNTAVARADAMEDLTTFLDHHAQSPEQRALFHHALHDLQHQCDDHEALLLCLDLPHALLQSLRTGTLPLQPLLVVTTLLYLGIDLLDDLADGDLQEHWQGIAPAQIQLTATTLVSALPHVAIAALPVSDRRRAALHQTIADGLLRMSAGQQHDLAMAACADVTAKAVEASVAAKSGAEGAMFARLAALYANADARTVESCAAYGQAIGTAGQLASDCYDLFQAPVSRDLTNGTRTWPIAAYLESLSEPERSAFNALLQRAQSDHRLHPAIRERLHHWAAVRRCACLVECYCHLARQALSELSPVLRNTEYLCNAINHVSFFPRKENIVWATQKWAN